MPIGEKSEVADAHETFRKHVKQKAGQEFFCGNCHIALYVSMGSVSPAERNLSILKRDQPMVGNGHSMGVAAEIFENMFRAAEGPFAIDHPILTVEIANQGMKHLRVRKMLKLPVKADLTFGECLVEGVFDLSSKDLPEHPLRQKEPIAGIGRYPVLMIE